MRGKSYLQIGSICMGIGGSIIDSKFIEEYLGMRVESVDEVEVIRRMTEGIYDEKELEKRPQYGFGIFSASAAGGLNFPGRCRENR